MITTKDIMDRAAGLADLQNSGYITQNDRLGSLNEAYRDLYEGITKGDDDFFLKYATLDPATVAIIDENQFTIDLPSDFFRLRTASWNDNGTWLEIQKFPINVRETHAGRPFYRFRGGKMWISGVSTSAGVSPTIRIDYYPMAETMECPDDPIVYTGLTVVPTSMAYAPKGRTIIYTTGTDIHAFSADDFTDYLLYTSAGIADLGYLNGYIYFRKGSEVWRGSTDLKSTMVPGAITATGGAVVNTTLMWGYVYWSTATQCYRSNLDGTNVTLRQNTTVNYVAPWGADVPYYGKISATNTLVIDAGLATGISITQLAGDGTHLYYRTPASEVYRILPTLVAGVYTTVLLATGVAYMGVYADHRLPIYCSDGSIQALSTYAPLPLSFNQNVAYEILSYRCAADFKRKNNADATQLTARLNELWDRFNSQRSADDYKPERIQNAYYGNSSPWR